MSHRRQPRRSSAGSTKRVNCEGEFSWSAFVRFFSLRKILVLLSVLRRYGPNGRGKDPMSSRIHRVMPDRTARQVLPKIIVALPICRRPNWSGDKASSAVRTNVEQDFFDARRAKRAFIAADAGID